MKGSIEKQATKKRENNILGSSILFYFFQKAFQKKSCGAMTFFWRILHFWLPFALVICEECMVKMFDLAFVSFYLFFSLMISHRLLSCIS
jgi:hypothetical protein